MTHPEQFIGWLEGYLDAKKNDLSRGDARKIRKKIEEYRVNSPSVMIPMHDSPTAHEQFDSITEDVPVDPEFLAAVAANSGATSMDELA